MIRPTSTYRLQFRGDMDLDRAAGLARYFARLGISHLYASPVFTAAPDSTHGYDVADFCAIDPAIGGIDGFKRLSAALKTEGLGLIVDFVPNHMGATTANPWWRDVLEWGADSDFREHFDINWSAPKLIVPALGEPYGEALANGRFGLAFDARAGGISLTYYDLRLPLTPPSYARILAGIDVEAFPELARRFAVARPETAAQLKEDLASLARDPAVGGMLDEALAATAADHAALHELHEAQIWRASYWRAAREDLTYRRFFEIADLVGVRVERPRVFDDVHSLLFQLVRDGMVDGIRLDHVDGLADPKAYLQRLQEAIGDSDPYYLLVEKILGAGETLRPSWPVAGTTGYEFIEALAGLLVDASGEAALTAAYEDFLGGVVDYPNMVRETKRRTLARNLAGELDFLKDLAKAVATRDPATRDHGADSLRRAILEFAAALPVYRTYVNVEGADENDLTLIADASTQVKATREVEDEGAVDFIAKLLRLDFPDPEIQAAALEFTARFQQTTGPVMAKALEDTVFYRFNRLIALNEVGGEPHRVGARVEAFHGAMQSRLAEQKLGLSATATHDTKRGEDARARLYAISESPEDWRAAVSVWRGILDGRTEIDGAMLPEPEFEWLFYQALAGAWPAELRPDHRDGVASLRERVEAYMLKVVREAKLRTSWSSPNTEYEAVVTAFVRAALDNRGFLDDFFARSAPLRLAGVVNSLSQLAIKLAAPGVPDIYQGTEFWDLSFVDPDNRRPFGYESRFAAVDTIDSMPASVLLADWPTGLAKMRLMHRGLGFRREHAQLFADGDYIPIEVTGERAGHVVAFGRRLGGEWLIAVTTRFPLALLDDAPLVAAARWGDTAIRLPGDAASLQFRDIVFGSEIAGAQAMPVSAILSEFPAALLHGVR
jgi:(1->4)-alpha-D-glucan 1-alpha-D-glucosylmutase